MPLSSKDSVQEWRDHCTVFSIESNWSLVDAYRAYNEWCRDHRYNVASMHRFSEDIPIVDREEMLERYFMRNLEPFTA